MAVKTFPAILIALVLTIAGCAPVSPAVVAGEGSTTVTGASLQPHVGGTLRVGQAASDLGTLDPDYASGTQDRALIDMVFNGLLRYKPGDATTFEPDLATNLPDASAGQDGHQTWSFSLRHGVMCHPSDGVPA